LTKESKRGGAGRSALLWRLQHGATAFDPDYTGEKRWDDEKINLGSLPPPLSPYNIA